MNTSRPRKRRAHTKSRGGCGNCKLRRVKCDEAKPSCCRCKSYGVTCAYESPDMRSFGESVFVVPPPAVSSMGLGPYVPPSDMDILVRFRDRTVLTMGDDSTRHVFQREALRLAFQHPFLMHVALTMTLAHDRLVREQLGPDQQELFHWNRGVSLFNRKLSQPLTASERDAVWITSALLGCTSLAHAHGTTPDEVWPLAPAAPSDLDWIKLGSGKKAVWELANASRADSVLREMSRWPTVTEMADDEALAALPPEMVELCGLDREKNLFYQPATMLGRLMPLQHNDANRHQFMAFFSAAGARPFVAAAERKDPRALLIVAFYVAKLQTGSTSPWWATPRFRLEAESICRYLERFHGDVRGLGGMLSFVRGGHLETRDFTPLP